MDVKLVIGAGPAKTKFISLRQEEAIIGRQKGCQIRIPSSTVSRQHCLLRFRDGYLTAEDLDSVNGTFLNGERITGREVVRPGDRLKIGPLVFVAKYQLTPDAISRLSQDTELTPVEDVTEFLPVVDDEPETVQVEMAPVEPVESAAPTEDYAAPVVIDDAEPLVLPEAGELRDILSRMDEK
jgi:pSer/pThr/pTyr-binding forkhead associated (FHA) protein